MTGIVVIELAEDGQAAKVGIRIHDLIYKYNGVMLNSTDELISASRTNNPQNEMIVIRGKEILKFVVASGSLGVSVTSYPVQDIHLAGVGEVLARLIKNAIDEDWIETKSATDKKNTQLLEKISSIQITTTPQLEGYRVTQTLDIITAEYVGGINLFRDLLVEVRDIVGGRSGTLQNELRKARKICMDNLKAEACDIGANAVIGVDLDYSEISGGSITGGKSMLLLVASGTAVIVEKT